MKNPLKMSLALRIVILIIFSLVFTSLLILWRSEQVVETALLDQIKKQAWVFMVGIEKDIHHLSDPNDRQALQELIDKTLITEHREELGFSIFQIYFFNDQGEILAHSEPGPHPVKKIETHYRAVFEHGRDYMGDAIEYALDPKTGLSIPKADIIVPLHHNGKVTVALEVEINLQETLEQIQTLDDRYEAEIMSIVAGSLVLTFLFIWWTVHHYMLDPISEMNAVTRMIATGEMETRVTHTGEDELGQLAASINHMAASIGRLFNEQEEAHVQMLQTLAKALEAKDRYTAKHSGRVAAYAVKLGCHIKLPDEQLLLLKQGALMHDLGKIGIADAILNKPDRLTNEEYEIMKQHPELTATIMRPLKRFKEFTEIAAWHHERWDGNGYPDGLKGEEIPLLARIVGIADTWDAMTGDRIYRKAIPIEKALDILEKEQHSGQWDPQLVEAFVKMMREEAKRVV